MTTSAVGMGLNRLLAKVRSSSTLISAAMAGELSAKAERTAAVRRLYIMHTPMCEKVIRFLVVMGISQHVADTLPLTGIKSREVVTIMLRSISFHNQGIQKISACIEWVGFLPRQPRCA